MGARIENYNLFIADRNESSIKIPLTEYRPFGDGWTLTDEDIDSLAQRLRWLIKQGYHPITAIFTEERR